MNVRRVILGTLMLLAGAAGAVEPLRFGVLAARPPEVMQAQFQPLADYLSAALGGRPVTLHLLDPDQLQHALDRNALDLVFTSPTSYLRLRSRSTLSGALATVRTHNGGRNTTLVGGVVFTRAERTDIDRLADLRGKRVGIPDARALGGFQAQALELRVAGIAVPVSPAVGTLAKRGSARAPLPASDITFQTLGSCDAVVAAVLAGHVDAGFVRTGLLEALTAQDRLDPARLRVVNRQALADFPFVASTRLYPDWPLVALPQLDDDSVRRVTAAALALDASHPAARAAGIGGFSPPADYLPVEDLARALRLPPYEQPPSVPWRDLWRRYWPTLLVLTVAAAGLMVMLAQLAARNRVLRRGEAALIAALAEQRALLAAMPFPVFEIDAQGRVLRVFARSDLSTTIDPQRVLGRTVAEAFPADVAARVMTALADATRTGINRGVLLAIPSPHGVRDIEMSISAIDDTPPRFLALTRDVTVERENQRRADIAASVLTHAGEGILISGPDSRILAVNAAFIRILGYADEAQLIGRPTSELSIQFAPGESYAALRRRLEAHDVWQGEVSGRRPDGTAYTATLHTRAVRDNDGKVTHHVAILTDVTLLKAQQQQLEHIAYHDVLTGLPNRALLADRLQQAMAHADRHGGHLAVAYIDLDGFKAINDVHGHAVGDRLLVAVAEHMKLSIREGDTLARMGGDEFVAVLTDLGGDSDCLPLIERLLAAACDPVLVDTVALRVTASIGVALYPQPDTSSADQLLRRADYAMYEAKLGGKNRCNVYGAATGHPLAGQLQQVASSAAAGRAQAIDLD